MWMVVRTKPRAEKKVELLLNRISLDRTAKPLVANALLLKVKRKWSDRTKIVEIPSVSGYVFVRFSMEMPDADKLRLISKICFTPGVLRFITLPGKSQFQPEGIATISDRELEICHAAAQESGEAIVVDENPSVPPAAEEPTPLTLGTEVRFRQGPLAKLEAKFIVEDINDDTPTLFINEGIFKNARFTVPRDLLEIVK